MADKLSWSELRRTVAARAGVSEKEAGAFLTALNAQLIEALKEDKQVKINGLGTFRLQAVAPRKSVNVTTGEEITIEGYNKMTFMPEAGLKEMIENNVSEPTPSLVNDEVTPLKKLGAQAEEIVDILGELGQSPKEEPAKEPVEEPKPAPEPAPEPVFFPEPVAPEEDEKPKKRYHFLRDTLICVVILLLLLLLGYFFLRNRLSNWIDDMVSPAPTEQVVAVADTTVIESAEVAPQKAVAKDEIREYKDFITTESMHQDSRLAWMSYRFYGDKRYWPYLYDANKDHIDNPSFVKVGTPIRVPRLTKAQRDTTSAEFLKLKKEAEAAIR